MSISQITDTATRGSAYVVAFLLEPVQRLLGAVRTVSGRGRFLVVGVGTAAARDLGFGEWDVRGRASDVALEAGHIVCKRLGEKMLTRELRRDSLCSPPLSCCEGDNCQQSFLHMHEEHLPSESKAKHSDIRPGDRVAYAQELRSR